MVIKNYKMNIVRLGSKLERTLIVRREGKLVGWVTGETFLPAPAVELNSSELVEIASYMDNFEMFYKIAK